MSDGLTQGYWPRVLRPAALVPQIVKGTTYRKDTLSRYPRPLCPGAVGLREVTPVVQALKVRAHVLATILALDDVVGDVVATPW